MGVTYRSNEAYFDLIEEIDAIIDRNGATVMCEIQGYVSRTKNRFYFNSFLIIIRKDTKNNLLVRSVSCYS